MLKIEKLLIKAIAIKLINFTPLQITFVQLIGYRLKEEDVLVRLNNHYKAFA